jgi:hypothetical protein
MFTDLWNTKPCVLVNGYRSFVGKFSILLQGRVSRFPEDGVSRSLETPALTRSTMLKAANLKLSSVHFKTHAVHLTLNSQGWYSLCLQREGF